LAPNVRQSQYWKQIDSPGAIAGQIALGGALPQGTLNRYAALIDRHDFEEAANVDPVPD
jgi:hypothetical protein